MTDFPEPAEHVDLWGPATLTTREWFAGMALQGLLAGMGTPASYLATKAYEIADTMIAEGEKRDD